MMNQKVKVVCPYCQKQYSIRKEWIGKSLACKACGKSFKGMVGNSNSEKNIRTEKPPIDRPAQGVFKQEFLLQNKPPLSGHPRKLEHRKNPLMFPAVMGATLFCLVLLPLAFLVNIYVTQSFAREPASLEKVQPAKDDIENESKRPLGKGAPIAMSKESASPPNSPKKDRPAKVFTTEEKQAARAARLTPREYEEKFDHVLLRVRLDYEGGLTYGGAVDAEIVGDKVVIASDRSIMVYDYRTGTELFEYDELEDLGKIMHLALSADGSRLFVGGKTGKVLGMLLSDEGKISVPYVQIETGSRVRELQVSRDHSKVVTVDKNRRLNFWNAENGSFLGRSQPVGLRDVKWIVNGQDDTTFYAIHGGKWTCFNWNDTAIAGQGMFSDEGAEATAISNDGKRIAMELSRKIKVFELGRPKPIYQAYCKGRYGNIALSNRWLFAQRLKGLDVWNYEQNSQQEETWVEGQLQTKKLILDDSGSICVSVGFSEVVVLDTGF